MQSCPYLMMHARRSRGTTPCPRVTVPTCPLFWRFLPGSRFPFECRRCQNFFATPIYAERGCAP